MKSNRKIKREEKSVDDNFQYEMEKTDEKILYKKKQTESHPQICNRCRTLQTISMI